jgi:hypothetical protein
MDAALRKRMAAVFLVVTIAWFAIIGLMEARYLIRLLREKPTVHHVVKTVYEEQIEGINFLLVLIFLVPGLFSWAMYARFKKEY